jgi:hypothetical protein
MQGGEQPSRDDHSTESYYENEVSGQHVKPGWVFERVLPEGDFRPEGHGAEAEHKDAEQIPEAVEKMAFCHHVLSMKCP